MRYSLKRRRRMYKAYENYNFKLSCLMNVIVKSSIERYFRNIQVQYKVLNKIAENEVLS